MVIVIGCAREIMRLIQGYTCAFGIQPRISVTGNQAVCVECTAYPIQNGELNLSLLCSGTRHWNKWQDSEVGVGIPYDKLSGTVQGVRDTVNGTETDERKREIIRGLSALGCETDDITMESAYFLRAEREKHQRRDLK